MKSRTYRFIKKDPICDEIATLVDDAGLRGKHNTGKVAILATLAKATVDNLLYGDTRSPQNRTIMSIATALGYERSWKRTTNKFDVEAELAKARAYIKEQRKLIAEANKRAGKKPRKRKPALKLVA